MEETRFISPPSSAAAPASEFEEHNLRDEQNSDSEDLEKQPLIVKKKNGLLGRVSQWKKGLIAITFLLGHLSVNIAYSTIGPFFPNEAAEQGSTPLLTGFIISCAPLCVVILSPIIGYYIPQLGSRFILLSGLWLVGGSYILFSFIASMPSGWMFIMFSVLLRLTEGVGSAMFITSVWIQLPELFPHCVATMTGFMAVAGCSGFALGPLLGGLLYSVGGFKLPFLTVGGLCLFILFPTYFLLQGSNCERQVLSIRLVIKLLSNVIYLLLVITTVMCLASWGFFYPTLEPFLSSQFHLDKQKTGLIFLSLSACSILCAPLIGKLADKFGSRKFVIAGCAVTAASFFFVGPADFISQPQLWITVVATSIFGLGSALIYVPNFKDMLAVAKSVEDTEATSMVVAGIASSAFSLGEVIGPLIGGGLTQVMDFPTSAMVFGVILIAQGCLLLGATVIDQLAAEQGSTPLLTGVIISCAPLCVVILSPIIGYYIPQLGSRFILLSGLWLVGGSYILLSFVTAMPSGWMFVMFSTLLRLTEGVGSAMFSTSVYAQLPELFPQSVGTMTGFMTMAGSLGFAIGPPLGGLLYSVGGFKLPFLTVGGWCLFILFIAYLLMQDSNCKKQVISIRTVIKLFSNIMYLLLVVTNALCLASWGFFYPTLEPFLSSQFHLDKQQTGLIFLSLVVFPVLCGPLIGKLADKFGPRKFVITGCAITAASFFFVGPADFISQPQLWITVVATTIFGLGASVMQVPIFKDMLAVAKSVEDTEATSMVVSGITSSAFSFGEFIGPLVGGGLTQVMDFPMSAMVFGEILLAEGCLLLGATLIDQLARRQ